MPSLKRLLTLSFLTLFLFSSTLLRADSTASSTVDSPLRSFSDVGATFESLGFNGVAMVATGDQVQWSKAFGQKNVEDLSADPLSTDTQFAIGSISKQFTSALILRMQERGLLLIGDSLDKYFPDYPQASKITLKQLMSHTAGVPNYTDDSIFWKFVESVPFVSLKDIFNFFWHKELDFEPNSKHSYSNSGYILLGALLQNLSGKDYGTLLHDEIFEPLGMKRSLYDETYDYSSEARGHGFDRDYGYIRSSDMSLSWAHAAGGIVSNLEDLRLWNFALDQGTFISKESVALMAKPVNVPGSGGYGLGLVTAVYKGMELQWHTGGLPGFMSYSMRVPAKSLSITVFTNTDDTYLRNQFMNALLFVALDGEAKAPAPILEVEVPAEMLKRREGSFFCEELGMTALVELEGSRLYLSLKNSDDSMQPQLYMMPQDEKLFFLRDIASLKYVTSENNQEQIELVQSGRKFIFKRM